MKERRKKMETEGAEAAKTAAGGAEQEAAAGSQAAPTGDVQGQGAGGAESAAPAADAGQQAARRVVELEDRLLRLQADFDNYRKRMAREREDLWRQAHGDVIGELLTVIDHLDLALKSAADHEAPVAFTDGFRMVRDQFMASLQKYGLKDVDAEGCPFDPGMHEAVAHLPSDAVAENHVMVQTRRGFMLGDRLLRPAQVVVSKGSEADEAAAVQAGGGNEPAPGDTQGA